MNFRFFKSNKKGEFVGGIMSVIMGVILIVAVAIPVTKQVIASANLTGVTATVVGLIPLLLGVLGLGLVMVSLRS